MHIYSVGDRYNDFEVTKSLRIEELKCHLTEMTHRPTGALVMHIGNDDPENLFCLSFQTRPETSNGVAHILEHTVLCGSQKFPVKDPFFAMTRRSLNTFMNALTGQDFTCYPAASQVPKDFYNLLEVYLDAVFHPNLSELSFMQEGHRLEFAEPSDPTSPLQFKGIVYNEMKGGMSSHQSRLHESLFAALFPDLTYGVNSGGDPKEIPNLTYEGLLDFHRKFYHPSRCLFFFYGDIPLEQHLDFIDSHTLNKATALPPLPPIPKQKRFDKPKCVEGKYPISEDEKDQAQSYVSFAWLTGNVLDQEELLALCIVEMALMDTDAAPLKMAFLKSGLCSQATAYIDPEISESPVVITLRGCDAKNADRLKDVLDQTLKGIIENGLPSHLIDNAMHQLELMRCEICGDQSPFGLVLFMRSGLLKQHGANPEDGLKIHSFFDAIREKAAHNPRYYTDLIKKYFVDNPHFLLHIMQPDAGLSAQENAEESARLQEIRNRLTDVQVQTIVRKADELAALQKAQEEADVDVLPRVTLFDVPKESKDYALERKKIGNLEVFYHDCFTNNILYTDLVWELPKLEKEDLWLVRFFTLLVGQMGCGKRSYADTLEYIQAHTGGIAAGIDFNVQAENHLDYRPTLHLKSKALYRKAQNLFTLTHEMANSIDFSDAERLKEVLMKHYTGLVSSFNQHALKYALGIAQSGLSSSFALGNVWFGIDYFEKIKDLVQQYDKKESWLIARLSELKEQLFCLEHPHLVITCDREMFDTLCKEGFYGLSNIETKPSNKWKNPIEAQYVVSQGRAIASPVAFTGKALNTVSYINPDAPALSIAANLLDNCFLHRLIREQGGAYGGGATSNSLSGSFTFYAYRDPNIVATIDAFSEAVKGLLSGDFDEQDIEEAKLEKVQGLDSPISPGSRGDMAYEWYRQNRNVERRQAFRDRLLAVNKDEIIRVVKERIAPQLDTSSTVVFAGKELLDTENSRLVAVGKAPLKIEI